MEEFPSFDAAFAEMMVLSLGFPDKGLRQLTESLKVS